MMGSELVVAVAAVVEEVVEAAAVVDEADGCC